MGGDFTKKAEDHCATVIIANGLAIGNTCHIPAISSRWAVWFCPQNL